MSDDLYQRIAAYGPDPNVRRRYDVPFDPEAFRREIEAGQSEYQRRLVFVEQFAWAVPDKEAIERIATFAQGRILEVMAGRGLWARLLRDIDAEVVATDSLLPENIHHHIYPSLSLYTEVETLDALTAVKTIPADTLMMCWPPMDTVARRALKAFRGDRFVYIGEGAGGCTGDDAFHRALVRYWREVDVVFIPEWEGIHDALYLYERLAKRS